MKLGVAINETWSFFHEVYAEFSEHHQTTLYKARKVSSPVFQDRLNRYLSMRGLSNFLRSNEVVFFEWASELLAAASRLPKSCGIVTRLHRYEMYQWADQVCWDAVDKIILVSRAKQKEFAARFPEQAAKVIVIPEAISLQKFHPQPKPFAGNIGILCHLSPRKRVYELILAFNELRRQRSGLRLHVGGGRHPKFADYYEAVHALVRKLNLQDSVVFYDNVSNPEVWYLKIDIFISNSYSEGLQVSPMEAIASGCYCLSHWWDGADELLPTNDLFCTDGELIRKIGEYCDTSEGEREAGRAGQNAIVRDRFDVAKTKIQIRQLVEGVADSRAGRL